MELPEWLTRLTPEGNEIMMSEAGLAWFPADGVTRWEALIVAHDMIGGGGPLYGDEMMAYRARRIWMRWDIEEFAEYHGILEGEEGESVLLVATPWTECTKTDPGATRFWCVAINRDVAHWIGTPRDAS